MKNVTIENLVDRIVLHLSPRSFDKYSKVIVQELIIDWAESRGARINVSYVPEGGIAIVEYKEPTSRVTGEEISIEPELSVADVLEEMDNEHDHY